MADKTGTEKMARWMGCYNYDTATSHLGANLIDRDNRWFDWSEMKYSTSWDWLMPVVGKIDKLYHEAFPSNDEFIRRILAKETPLDGPYMDVIALPLATPIGEVYEAVLKFIDWYTTKQKQG